MNYPKMLYISVQTYDDWGKVSDAIRDGQVITQVANSEEEETSLKAYGCVEANDLLTPIPQEE